MAERCPEHEEWPVLPDPPPADPYNEDGYCEFCGNGKWKHHAPWCAWADVRDGTPCTACAAMEDER